MFSHKAAKPVVFILALGPLAWVTWAAVSSGFGPAGPLGANPIEYINRFLGDWAIRFLLAALAVTPVSRVMSRYGGWSGLMRFRRMIGLYAFFYVCLHLSSYIGLDQFFDWREIWRDITKRNYITVGMVCFVLLAPLAATSTNAMIKRLGGKRWTRLHKLVYPAGLLACLHFYMMRKGIQLEPIIYAAICAVLLGYRVVQAGRKKARSGGAKPAQ
ncbi:MAG: sulfoxide reductase heme-binding subunit YedZ [Rhodospirillales bacterium]|nr:sulfoxide reductase heme-binding subunit YedZ [Alphaproteobacteria bacterium]MBL6948559.1 sulfoxide reductase heme-binding subunit YedZ [Rhodospirillales bacterium]